MSLGKKEMDLFQILKLEKISIKDLAKKFGVTERYIRYFLENLEFYLKKILAIPISRKDKTFFIEIDKFQYELFLNSIYKNYYNLNQEERIENTLMYFLFVKNINLNYIENKLSITRRTLKSDIDILNKFLQKYDLEIISFKNKFKISGNEKKLRHLKTLKLLENMIISENKFNFNIKNYLLITKEDILENLELSAFSEISLEIKNIESRMNIIFPEEFKSLMIIFIIITLDRIDSNNIIQKKSNYTFLINTKYFDIVKEEMKNFIPYEYSFEISHLTEYFISGGASENIHELENNFNVFFENLILFLKENISLDIDELNFKKNLYDYLIPAIYRLRNNFSIGTVNEKDELFIIIEDFVGKDHSLPEKLTENEIYFIRTILKKEIEKSKHKVISLKELLTIASKNSSNLNVENFKKELLKHFETVIKNDI